MKTAILCAGDQAPVIAKESYLTVKKRLLDGCYFFEITVEGKKMLFNKTVVMGVRSIEEEKEVTVNYKKTVAKEKPKSKK